MNNPTDRLPGTLAASNITRERLVFAGRRILAFVSVAYLVMLVGGLLTLQWVGERN